MPNSTEMNDWKEYQKQLRKEMDRQVTSNKALLWVGIAVNGLFNVITLVIAIVALINALMIGRDNLALQKEVSECKTEIKTSFLKIKTNYETERHSKTCESWSQ